MQPLAPLQSAPPQQRDMRAIGAPARKKTLCAPPLQCQARRACRRAAAVTPLTLTSADVFFHCHAAHITAILRRLRVTPCLIFSLPALAFRYASARCDDARIAR